MLTSGISNGRMWCPLATGANNATARTRLTFAHRGQKSKFPGTSSRHPWWKREKRLDFGDEKSFLHLRLASDTDRVRTSRVGDEAPRVPPSDSLRHRSRLARSKRLRWASAGDRIPAAEMSS